MARYLFASIISVAAVALGKALAFVVAPVVYALEIAFPRPDPTPAQRDVVEAASTAAPAFVASFLERRLAWLPNARRGPWIDQTVGLALAA